MLAAQGLLEISLVDPHTYEKALKRLLIMGSRVRVPPRSPNKFNTMCGLVSSGLGVAICDPFTAQEFTNRGARSGQTVAR